VEDETLPTDPNALFFFNGIDGASGQYLLPPMPPSTISKAAQGYPFDPQHLKDLQYKYETARAHFGLMDGLNPNNLADSGWGVIFAHNADPAIREALGELLSYRRQAAKNRYKECVYYPGESKNKFLGRYGAGPGPVDPDKLPYYLLIVGDPEAIPYRFQYQLDVQFAVGRLHFDTKTFDEYKHYAESVITAESTGATRPRRAVFFGVENAGDRATAMSIKHLVTPLSDKVKAAQPSWRIETFVGPDATKSNLSRLLGPEGSPALLFTASHGMGFQNGDDRQLTTQGALLCGDWPGPDKWQGPVPKDFYFAASDVTNEAAIHGMIAIHFACYGLGTPHLDEFSQPPNEQPIAPYAFVAPLPQRMLGIPNGALAVVGHIERAWSYSFAWPGAGSQITAFQDLFYRLMNGNRVGYALESFNERSAELASMLSDERDQIAFNKTPDDAALSGLWIALNDARNYAILGDPAVKLYC
jgi:hypothetical protein